MTLILHPALFLELVEVKEKVATQWWVKCEMGQICLKLTHCPSSGVSAFNWSKLSTDVAQKHCHSACFYPSELALTSIYSQEELKTKIKAISTKSVTQRVASCHTLNRIWRVATLLLNRSWRVATLVEIKLFHWTHLPTLLDCLIDQKSAHCPVSSGHI